MSIMTFKRFATIAIASLPLYTVGCVAGDEDVEDPGADSAVVGEEEGALTSLLSFAGGADGISRVNVAKVSADSIKLTGRGTTGDVLLAVSVKVNTALDGRPGINKAVITASTGGSNQQTATVFFRDNGARATPAATDSFVGGTDVTRKVGGVLTDLRAQRGAGGGCVGVMTFGMSSAMSCFATTAPGASCTASLQGLAAAADACR